MILMNLERRLLTEKHIETDRCSVLLEEMSKEITDRGWLQKGIFLSFQGAFLNLEQMMERVCMAVTSFRILLDLSISLISRIW